MEPNVQLTSTPNALIPPLAGLMGLTGQRRLSHMMRNARRQSAKGQFRLA